MKAIRWSRDRDKYVGCFTICKNDRHHNPIDLLINSGGGDDRISACHVRISSFGYTVLFPIPRIIKPWKQWIDTSKYEWSKNPEGGYWDYHPKEYGVHYLEGYLRLSLGAQTMSSCTTQGKAWFLPWTQWRHVRHSLYTTDGQWFCDTPDYKNWEEYQKVVDSCPTITFKFKDYDGEELTAKTRIEEREWRFGTGYFKWLSLFRKPKIARSLDIRFSGETGKRKGSWKGGTIGHGIDMLKNETPWQAFKRYCDSKDMTFLGIEA